jgi:hypothetical protein
MSFMEITLEDSSKQTISNGVFALNNRPKGTFDAVTHEARFETGEIRLVLRALLDGELIEILLFNTDAVTGTLNPDDDIFDMGGTFSGADITLDIQMLGHYAATPPISQTLVDAEVECTGCDGAEILADGHSIPVGEPMSHQWFIEAENGGIWAAPTTDEFATLFLPIGVNKIRHKIFNTDGVWDISETSVSVQDGRR